jgi:uncharacterized SAM-binding protein YcdF (DUF218 family)
MLDDARFLQAVQIIWDFLSPTAEPEQADAIFVFGGIDLKVPEKASALWHGGYCERVVITGGAGVFTHTRFSKPEAVEFRDVMLASGVPASAITIEVEASNSGQNVEFGMRLLGPSADISRLLIVAKPFIVRRAIATFAKQFPHIEILPCPPTGSMASFVDRTERDFCLRLVAEIERIDSYAGLGFITPVVIPENVREAVGAVRAELTTADE